MSLFAQIEALACIDAASEVGAVSPDLLAGRVRAFANLSQLTRSPWTSTHKVFGARSLLAAERLIRTAAPANESWARAHRAYALALIGLHSAALAELSTIEESSDGPESGGRKPPHWVALLEHYCNCDLDGMTAFADQNKSSQLALFLHMLALEPSFSYVPLKTTAERVLEANPQCFRAWRVYCDVAYREEVAAITEGGSRLLFEAIESLPDRADFPSDLKADWSTLLAGADSSGLWVAPGLADAGERLRQAEVMEAHSRSLDWGALATMLEDAHFAFVLAFIQAEFDLGRVHDECLRVAQTALTRHPLVCLLMAAEVDPDQDPEAFVRACQGTRPRDLSLAALRRIRSTWPVNQRKRIVGYRDGYYSSFVQSDQVVDDLFDAYNYTMGEPVRRIIWRWFQVSSRAPTVKIGSVWYDWKCAESMVEEWLDEYPAYPTLHDAISRQYQTDGRITEAIRMMEQEYEIDPSATNASRLGDLYVITGDHARACAILDGYLAQSSPPPRVKGWVQGGVGFHYLALGDYSQALARGGDAAGNGYDYGYLVAAGALAAQGDWAGADAMVERFAQKDEPQLFDAYFWKVQNQRGGLDELRQRLDQRIKRQADPTGVGQTLNYGTYLQLEDRPRQAADVLVQYFRKSDATVTLMHALFIKGGIPRSNARRYLLQAGVKAVRDNKRSGIAYSPIARLFDIRYRLETSATTYRPTAEELEKELARAKHWSYRPDVEYFAGLLFFQMVDRERGLEILRKCRNDVFSPAYLRALASEAIRQGETQLR
jgi:tetratricopeptide (TPR) repeat protein